MLAGVGLAAILAIAALAFVASPLGDHRRLYGRRSFALAAMGSRDVWPTLARTLRLAPLEPRVWLATAVCTLSRPSGRWTWRTGGATGSE